MLNEARSTFNAQDVSKQTRISFDYGKVIKGQNMELNIMLRPGDTIVVPH